MQITYNESPKRFKITVTTDNKLRIKVPKILQGSPEEKAWIETSNNIFESIKDLPREYTVRGKTELIHGQFGHKIRLVDCTGIKYLCNLKDK